MALAAARAAAPAVPTQALLLSGQPPGPDQGGGTQRRLLAMDWVRTYRKEWLGKDVLAGLITAAVVIPKAMAYATIAGVPVQVGIYTTLTPMITYALLGTSRPLSFSTSTTIAILVAAHVEGLDADKKAGALALLSLLVGLILSVAAVLRFGFVASFISEPVLVGFKAGIGVVIIGDQLPKLFGIHTHGSHFFRKLASFLEGLPHTSLPTLAVGASTVALLVAMKLFCPRVPAPLVAVAGGIAVFGLAHLEDHGVESVGTIPRGLPPLTAPDFGLIGEMWAGALGIALMSFTETIAAGRAFAASTEVPLRPNQELLANGLANVVGAFCSAMPSGGGTTQTAVNRGAGALTQLAGMVTAAAALVTMLLLAPAIELMPEATLAAVVIVYSVGLIQPSEFLAILKVRQMEFIWAVVALVGVVVLGTLKGILVAIIVSLASLVYGAVNAPVYFLGRQCGTNCFRPLSEGQQDIETFPGLLMLRLEGRVFFANAQSIADQIRPVIAAENPKVVLLDLIAVPDLEYTALTMLIKAEQKQRDAGIAVWLVGMNARVADLVRRSSLGSAVGPDRIFPNLEVAVATYLEASHQGAH